MSFLKEDKDFILELLEDNIESIYRSIAGCAKNKNKDEKRKFLNEKLNKINILKIKINDIPILPQTITNTPSIIIDF